MYCRETGRRFLKTIDAKCTKNHHTETGRGKFRLTAAAIELLKSSAVMTLDKCAKSWSPDHQKKRKPLRLLRPEQGPISKPRPIELSVAELENHEQEKSNHAEK